MTPGSLLFNVWTVYGTLPEISFGITCEGAAKAEGIGMKRWLSFLCYTAILADGLLISFLIGSGGWFWAIPNTQVPIIVPPAVVFVGLILAARRI
jgi:hypothetical protein